MLATSKIRNFVSHLLRKLYRVSPKSYQRRYSEYFGEKSDNYLKQREGTDGWKREHENLVYLLNKLPIGMTILDIPVGTGRFIQEYLKREHRVVGIDISDEMMKQAVIPEYARQQITLRVGDARSIPYADNTFDCTISFRFLGYIPPLVTQL
jgi:ubiquinone/menaquinone biosynthesis C-methylase UbiE